MIAIDHILTNSFVDKNFKIAIFKSVFQTIFLFALFYHQQNLTQKKTSSIFERIYKAESKNAFKQELHEANWTDTETFLNPITG